MRWKKQAVSLMLSCCMGISLLPVVSLAADEDAAPQKQEIVSVEEQQDPIVNEQQDSVSEDQSSVSKEETFSKETETTVSVVDSGTCGDDLTWTLIDDGVLTISGTGEMTNYSHYPSVPWYGYRDQINMVVIEDGITSIGDSAFTNCSALINVTLPDGVTSIGNSAFELCRSLMSVTIPDSVMRIGQEAFADSGVTNVMIPDRVTCIEDGAFFACGSLTNVTIPDSVTSIGDFAFSNCSSLENVTIQNANCEIADSGNTIYTEARIRGYLGSTAQSYAEKYSRKFEPLDTIESLELTTLPNIMTYGEGDALDLNGLALTASYVNGMTYIIGADNVTVDEYDFSTVGTKTITVYYRDYTASFEVQVVTTERIEIPASAYPESAHPYANNEDIYYTYTYPDASKLEVTFSESTQTENDYDNITLFNRNDVQVGTYSGTELAGKTITVTGDTIKIRLTSNVSSRYYGFSIDKIVAYDMQPNKVKIICQPTDYKGKEGTTAVFSVTTRNAEAYQWQYQNAGATSWANSSQDGNTTETLTVPITVARNGQKYRCVVTGKDGETVTSEAATLIWDDGTVASGTCGDDLTWTLMDDGVLTVRGTGEIPNYVHTTFVPWYDYCNQINTVVIEDGITAIGDFAFGDCSSLTSVIIPDSVTRIGDYAFELCSSLTSVTIPDSVTSIGDYAFELCSSLTSVTIPDGVTSIGDSAFANCSALTNVTIPDSVTSIGRSAFANCSALTNVTIPDSVTSIGNSAFTNCSALINVTLPDGVTSINAQMFWFCSSLTSVTIPNSVTSIGSNAFRGCSSLTSVTIPNSVTSIDREAFCDCSSLTSLTISSGVTSIGSDAFSNCSSLTSIVVDDDNPLYSSVDGVLFSKDKTELIYCPQGKTGAYAIPDGVTSIGRSAFAFCGRLTSVTIGSSVTSIGDSAFWFCSGLTSVTIPDSVTSIGEYAFYCCTRLLKVTIPNSVTSIGNRTFSNCTRLMNVMMGDGVTSIGDSAFYGCTDLTTILFGGDGPNISSNAFESVNAVAYYPENASGWETVITNQYGGNITWQQGEPEIISTGSGTCGDNLTWTLDSTGTLTISGTGAMDDYTSSALRKSPWHFYRENIIDVIIESGVTSVGNYAFYDCMNLMSITLPNGVTSIGEYALYNCDELASVTLPDSVTEIGTYAFYGCNQLVSINIPDGITRIEEQTFGYCGKLESITLPGSTTYLGNYAFEECDNLTRMDIPSSVTELGDRVFSNCNNLEQIYFLGNAPDMSLYTHDIYGYTGSLNGLTATLYYPSNAAGWDEAIAKDYGGTITWSAYNGLSITTQPSDFIGAAGTTATFAVEADGDNLTYQWQYQNVGATNWANSSQTGNKTAILAVPITAARDGQKYRCIITDANGNMIISSEVMLCVGTVLSITSQPSDFTGTVGETAVFTIGTTGDSVSYQWQYQNVGATSWANSSQTGNKTATLSVPITAARDGQKYRCIITDVKGNTITSDEAALHVETTPLAITSQPVDYTGAVGDTAAFTVEAIGENLTYQWQYQNVGATSWANSSQTGNKTATLSVPITAARDGQKYRCIVTDGNGNSVTSEAATLYVETQVVFEITSQPVDYTGAVGDTAAFTVEATGENLTYQWQYQNVGATSWANSSQTGNKTAILSVPITAARDGQKYRCIVTDGNGNSVTSEAATLYVEAQVVFEITSQPVDYTGAVGDTAMFTVAATGDNLTYQWQYQNVGATSWANSSQTGNKTATLSVPITAARNGQKYRCIITDGSDNTVTSNVATLHVS